MSDALHHAHPTATQANSVGRHKRFLETIRAKALELRIDPTIIRFADKPLSLPRPSLNDLAFGPIVHPRQKVSRPSCENIMQIVAGHYGLTVAVLMSNKRYGEYVRPRHVAFYLCRTLTKYSFPEIGRRCGGFDHTTIMHADRRVRALLAIADDETTHNVDAIREKIAARWPVVGA